MELAPLTPVDTGDALRLWSATEGLTLRDADAPEALARYLGRNPGMSWIARRDGTAVGAVICGHDGRRGYLHHLAVDPAHRRLGIGTALVERCLDALRAEGIGKCHLFVRVENEAARRFWAGLGWAERDDLVTMSLGLGGSANA